MQMKKLFILLRARILEGINRFSIFFIILFCYSIFLSGQEVKKKFEVAVTRILFVFDASYSMEAFWGTEKRITIARNTLIAMIDSLEKVENIEMALRVYGHQSPVPPQDCNDTKLEVPFGKNNAPAIRQKLRFLNPKGTTPIANTLKYVASDFAKPCDNCRNVVILITDGLEECKGDPCEVSQELQKRGIILKPFIIGIGIDENFSRSFECVGRFYNAMNNEQFNEVLHVVITQALNSTTAQVNLLDTYGRPTETDVNMTFFDNFSGNIMHNYIHTLNYNGYPDTIVLDPLVRYRLRVNTIPPVEVDDIRVESGKHTLIAAKTPQGMLIAKTTAGNQYRGIKFAVRQSGKSETLNFQELNQVERYLTGKYDIEIPVLPPLILKDVEIRQSHTTTIEIPLPGIVNILTASPGVGSIYVKDGSALKWVYNTNPDATSESVTLLPGNYVLVFRPKNARQTFYSVSKPFTIRSGSAESIKLN